MRLATCTYDSAAARRGWRRRWSTCRRPRRRRRRRRRRERSAPATEAAGPEYSVRAGAARKPARSVAPPSPRITITGACDAGRRATPSLDELGGAQRRSAGSTR